MHFERESPGIYRYHRKRVFMKIEGETIVIRVGGGYLTIDEFVEHYCGGEDDQKSKISSIVYGGQCAGNKDFKTFYFTHSAPDEVPDQGSRSPYPKGRKARLTLEDEQPKMR